MEKLLIMVYKFRKDAWKLLTKLFDYYEETLPIFLRENIFLLIERHSFDRIITSDTELINLADFFNTILQLEIEPMGKKKEQNNKKNKAQIEEDDLIEINYILAEIMSILSLKKSRDNSLNEERNGY